MGALESVLARIDANALSAKAMEITTSNARLTAEGLNAPGPITLEKAMEPEFAKENITRLVSQLYSVITSFG